MSFAGRCFDGPLQCEYRVCEQPFFHCVERKASKWDMPLDSEVAASLHVKHITYVWSYDHKRWEFKK